MPSHLKHIKTKLEELLRWIDGVEGLEERDIEEGWEERFEKRIEPKDETERLAATAFREAAKKTGDKAGDGTSSTIAIAGKLINYIYTRFSLGSLMGDTSGVMEIKRQLFSTAKKVVEEIKKRTNKVKSLEDLEKIAVISTENEELGKTIAKIAWEVGEYGFIDIQEGFKEKIETEIIKGARFPAKTVGKGFVNNPAIITLKS